MVAEPTGFEPFVSFDVEADRFRSFLAKTRKTVGNIRLGLLEIARDQYKNQQAVFLKGEGRYAPLSPAYRAFKIKKFGSPRILFLTGALQKSLLSNTGQGAVFKISERSLSFGTAVKRRGFSYPLALQEGTRKMPARPFWFIDAARAKRWTQILQNFYGSTFRREGIGR